MSSPSGSTRPPAALPCILPFSSDSSRETAGDDASVGTDTAAASGTTTQSFDLIILGLGPAGLALAHRAVARGWRVLGFDPSSHWANSYGIFIDEIPEYLSHLPVHCTRPRAVFPAQSSTDDDAASSPAAARVIHVDRRYAVVQRDKWRAALAASITGSSHLIGAAATPLSERSVQVDCPRHGSHVLSADFLIDARGAHPTTLVQQAVGVAVPFDGAASGADVPDRAVPGATVPAAAESDPAVPTAGNSTPGTEFREEDLSSAGVVEATASVDAASVDAAGEGGYCEGAGPSYAWMDFFEGDESPLTFRYDLPLVAAYAAVHGAEPPADPVEVMVEETLLIGVMQPWELFHERLAARGIAGEVIERVVIPMGRQHPRGYGIPFGARAGFIHPLTGYSLATSLGLVDPLLDALDDYRTGRTRRLKLPWERPIFRADTALVFFCSRVLVALSPGELREFFSCMLQLPGPVQKEFFERGNLKGTLVGASHVFERLPWRLKLATANALLRPAK